MQRSCSAFKPQRPAWRRLSAGRQMRKRLREKTSPTTGCQRRRRLRPTGTRARKYIALIRRWSNQDALSLPAYPARQGVMAFARLPRSRSQANRRIRVAKDSRMKMGGAETPLRSAICRGSRVAGDKVIVGDFIWRTPSPRRRARRWRSGGKSGIAILDSLRNSSDGMPSDHARP